MKTRMHSSRIRTARLLTVSRSIPWGEGGLPNPPDADPLLDADPPPLLDADPHPFLDADPPGHVTCNTCWEVNPHPVNRMTDRCKNITSPQTSFAGGNNTLFVFIMSRKKHDDLILP